MMTAQLHRHLLKLHKTARVEPGCALLPFGIPEIDAALGGGLMRGALHEIAAAGEAHLAAATGFALGIANLSSSRPDLCGASSVLCVTENMALVESGALHGAGLDALGFPPERLLSVSVAHRRDLLWAMEEALRCPAVHAVIGEIRTGEIDSIAVRRLSLAATKNGALALLLRAVPSRDASTAATRWIVGAASSAIAHGPGAPRFAAHLVRNRRGPVGSWILEWSDSDERFVLATHAQPVAAPALDRPHRQVA